MALMGILFSANVDTASISPSTVDGAFTLRAWSTRRNPLQPPIGYPVEIDTEGNAIVNFANNNKVLNYVCGARVLLKGV